MAASMVVLGDEGMSAACDFENCNMGTDGLRQCSMHDCTRTLHHCCFNIWADAHGVPELPGDKALCRECAEDVCLTATNRAASEESIKKCLEHGSQLFAGEQNQLPNDLTGCGPASEASSPPSIPDSTEELDGPTWSCRVVANLSLDPDGFFVGVKLQLTLRSTATVPLAPWHADPAVDTDAITEVGMPFKWVVCPSPRAAGMALHDTGMDSQPPTPGRCELPGQNFSEATPTAAEVEAVLDPEIGTRCCIRGLNGLVWDKRACSKTDEEYLAVIFDSWLTREWESYSFTEFAALATAPLTVAAHDIAAVLVCKQVGKGSLPSAVLSGPLEKRNNKFFAFSNYKPLPPSVMHSDPPIPFALEPGTAILCQQPCVSAGSAPNTVIPSDEIVVVEYCGILVAENSFKLERKPYSRWVVCLQGDDAVIFPFSSIVSLADASQRATIPAKSKRASCAETLAAAHLDARPPGGLEHVYKAALNELSANDGDGEAAASTGMNLRERRARPSPGHDVEKELSAGALRPRRGKAPASASTPESSATDVSDRPNSRFGTHSEIPLRLKGWGAARLDSCTLEQLCLSLTENGLEQPPKHIVDKAGWAKNELMSRLELLPFTQSPQKTQARL